MSSIPLAPASQRFTIEVRYTTAPEATVNQFKKAMTISYSIHSGDKWDYRSIFNAVVNAQTSGMLTLNLVNRATFICDEDYDQFNFGLAARGQKIANQSTIDYALINSTITFYMQLPRPQEFQQIIDYREAKKGKRWWQRCSCC